MNNENKNNSDFDLEKFVDLFDTAMSSDNPAVQRAFKNLLLVSTIVGSEEGSVNITKGPLGRLVDDVKNLSARVFILEQHIQQLNPKYHTAIPAVKYYTNTTTTTGTNSIPTITTQLTDIINSGKYTITTGTSSTAYDDQYKTSL